MTQIKDESIVKHLISMINDGYLNLTANINEAIYYHERIGMIDGEFDFGCRGLDHNCLLSSDISFTDLMINGVLLVPETNTYISDKKINLFKDLERIPLNNNHFVGFKN